MVEERSDQILTLALNTKVEEDFVAPLTAARGALEILRDFPDLGDSERQRFVATALRSCQQLEHAINELANTVYAAGQTEGGAPRRPASTDLAASDYAARIAIDEDADIMELDFSGLVFSSSQIVNEVHDAIEAAIQQSGRKWYFLINYQDLSIWPEAWVAFAHRGKRVNVNFSLGTARYSQASADSGASGGGFGEELFLSREMAVAKIDEMKALGASSIESIFLL